jgi:DNA topoisomerase IA
VLWSFLLQHGCCLKYLWLYATNATNADLAVRSKVWNDKKLSAHHAIIPTDNMQKMDKSNEKYKHQNNINDNSTKCNFITELYLD